MKKFAVMMMALMLAILAIIPVTFASAESANKTVYVATYDGKMLNLRAEPNTDARVIIKMGNGKPLTIIEDVNAVWMKVSTKYNGKIVKGYVMKTFVQETDPALDPQDFVKVNRFKVTVAPSNGETGHVNLRAKATLSSTILAYLHKGDVLTVVAESNAYYQVRTANGINGYVVKSCVNK